MSPALHSASQKLSLHTAAHIGVTIRPPAFRFSHQKPLPQARAARSRVFFFQISPIFRRVSCRTSSRSAVRYGEKATLSSP